MDEMLEALAVVTGHLRQGDTERAALLTEQDDLIGKLRAAGCSWPTINRVCGMANMHTSHKRRRLSTPT